MIHCLYEKVEDTKGVMAKRKTRKGQTMSYKTLHRKLKNRKIVERDKIDTTSTQIHPPYK
jgi:hypothetical protein